MTLPKSAADDALPASRAVRWVVLAGVILFAAGLYFRFGLRVPPIGSAPPASATSTTSTP